MGHSLLIGVSHHDDGGLWLEAEDGRHYEEVEGSFRAGHIFSTTASCVLFAGKTPHVNGRMPHWRLLEDWRDPTRALGCLSAGS